jgi:Ribbon-helix-helix protein, copG family
MATTVRVDEQLADTLRELAREEGRPIGRIIEDAVTRYQKERFWKGVHEDFLRLRSDPVAWKDYQDEIASIETGSLDWLDREPPYYTPEEEEEIRAEFARTQGGRDLGH